MTWNSPYSVGMRVVAARRTSFSLWMRYSIRALIVITLSRYSRPSAISSGRRAMPPSSSSTSQITPAGAAEHAARHGPQREDVPGTREVLRPRRRIHQRADGDRAIVGGGSGGHAPAGVHADREGGAERRGVVGDHHRDLQLVEALAEHGHADEPAPVLGHEVDRLRGRLLGGHEQVAFVLAVLVVDHDEHATGADLLDAFLDRDELGLAHRVPSLASGPFTGAGGSRNCSIRCTYLPIISISRFTRLPRVSPPRVVAARVCGMIMISKSRSLSRATVRLTPSTATEPCGISRGASASPGHSIVSRAVSASRVSAATVPTESTCPWTRCPPTMPPSRIGRSRLTGSPTARSPSAVRARVSGPTSKRSVRAPTSTTVRQAPFTATLAPTPLSSRTRSAPSTRRDPARSSTRPTSSTRPVNMSALHAAFQQPIVAERPRGQAAHAEGNAQREAGPARRGRRGGSAQELGGDERRHPVHQAGLHERAGQLAAGLEQHRDDVEGEEPRAQVGHVHPPVAGLALQHGHTARRQIGDSRGGRV